MAEEKVKTDASLFENGVIDVNINPSIKDIAIYNSAGSKKGLFRRKKFNLEVGVPIDKVAFVSFSDVGFDRDSLPEVYLGGEMIYKGDLHQNHEVQICYLSKNIGSISIIVQKEFLGISLTSRDLGEFRVSKHITVDDPMRVLSNWPCWQDNDESDYSEKLRKSIIAFAESRLIGGAGKVSPTDHIWTHVDVYKVADEFFRTFNEFLTIRGLRLRRDSTVLRTYPEILDTIVFEFKRAEQQIYDAQKLKRREDLRRAGLTSDQIVEMKRVSDSAKVGAGLLHVALSDPSTVKRVSQWFLSLSPALVTSADFLNKMHKNFSNFQQVELSKQILFSRFDNPLLGIGERGYMDLSNLEDVELYQMLDNIGVYDG